MSDFKGRYFRGEVILWAVRWYCRYGLSYRDLKTRLAERGVSVDHSTIYRWVQRYAPEMEKHLCAGIGNARASCAVDGLMRPTSGSKESGRICIGPSTKTGDTIDRYLSPTRNAKVAKALNGLKDWEKPEMINMDKASTYGIAISELKKDGKLPDTVKHRQVKYLNNVIESDHGKLKQLIKPVRGFNTLKTAYATIKGFEVMHALKKGQASLWQYQKGLMGEARLVERQFGVYTV